MPPLVQESGHLESATKLEPRSAARAVCVGMAGQIGPEPGAGIADQLFEPLNPVLTNRSVGRSDSDTAAIGTHAHRRRSKTASECFLGEKSAEAVPLCNLIAIS